MGTAKRFRGFRRAGAGRVAEIPAILLLMSAFLIFGQASGALAQGHLDIGAGSSFKIPEGGLHMGCGNFNVLAGGSAPIGAGVLDQVLNVLVENTGALTMLTGLIEFGGAWTVNGTFQAGDGTVRIADGCGPGTAVVNGSNTFCNLELVSSTGKQVNFQVGTTQTIACHFEATGVSGALERLRSTAAGQAAYICLLPGATQLIDYIDVADVQVPDLNNCQRLAPGGPGEHNSVDSGNTFGWFNNGIGLPIPTLSEVGFAVMALLMLLLGWMAIKRKNSIA